MNPSGSTAIVQGFGNVGSVTALTFQKHGTKVLGASDHTGAYFDPKGLDIEAMDKWVQQHGTLRGFSNELAIDPAEMLLQKCDILVPAAVERVIDADNARKLQCRVLAEGANGPTTPDADLILHERGDVFVIPDILANSGGVIVSYFEWVQDLQQFFWGEAEVNDKLNRVLEKAFNQVMRRVDKDKVPHRTAAMAIGVEKVRDAKRTRGLFP
jgi:glutamate dehydrogenase (NAD(P)+)